MVFLALGPLVGGLLTQWVSWRAVFFLNLPIGLVTLVAAHYTLPRAGPAARRAPARSTGSARCCCPPASAPWCSH